MPLQQNFSPAWSGRMWYFLSSHSFLVAAKPSKLQCMHASCVKFLLPSISTVIYSFLHISQVLQCLWTSHSRVQLQPVLYANTGPGTITLLSWYVNRNLTDARQRGVLHFCNYIILPVEGNLHMSTLTAVAYLHNNNTYNMTCIMATFFPKNMHTRT